MIRTLRRNVGHLALATALVGAVLAVGSGTSAAATSPVVAWGAVSAVNGVTTAGTCGTAGAAGTFTLATRTGARAVAVTSGTTFKSATGAITFAKVCVGRMVAAAGTQPATTLNAGLVVVAPALPAATAGIVSAVNGSTTAGTCGVAGGSATLTVITRTGTATVTLTPATGIVNVLGTAVGLDKVCVHSMVGVYGTTGLGTISASKVLVWTTPTSLAGSSVAFGLVTAVGGVTTPGTCGTAGGAGSFTVATRSGARTVAVTATTRFLAIAASPSYANVCVGKVIGALGTLSGDTLNAKLVGVAPPLPGAAAGVVTSVNGNSTPGTCGTAGSAGTFVLATRTGTANVTVTAGTAYVNGFLQASSFAKVCVNAVVGALGPVSGGTITATRVLVWAAPPA